MDYFKIAEDMIARFLLYLLRFSVNNPSDGIETVLGRRNYKPIIIKSIDE